MDESQSFKHSLMDTNLVRQSMIEYHMAVRRIVHNNSIIMYTYSDFLNTLFLDVWLFFDKWI